MYEITIVKQRAHTGLCGSKVTTIGNSVYFFNMASAHFCPGYVTLNAPKTLFHISLLLPPVLLKYKYTFITVY